MKTEETIPWERQAGETSKAYAAFCAYRDLGPSRSIPKAYQTHTNLGHFTTLKAWSAEYNWVERAQAYDDYIDAEKRAVNEEELRKMAERQAQEAEIIQRKVVQTLVAKDVDEITAGECAKLFDVAVKVERLARGAPTEKVDATIGNRIGADGRAEPVIIEVDIGGTLAPAEAKD